MSTALSGSTGIMICKDQCKWWQPFFFHRMKYEVLQSSHGVCWQLTLARCYWPWCRSISADRGCLDFDLCHTALWLWCMKLVSGHWLCPAILLSSGHTSWSASSAEGSSFPVHSNCCRNNHILLESKWFKTQKPRRVHCQSWKPQIKLYR